MLLGRRNLSSPCRSKIDEVMTYFYRILVANPWYARSVSGWCRSPLPPSTEAIAFSCKSESWLLILSMSIVDTCPISTEVITFWCESAGWLLILCDDHQSTPFRINRGNHLFMQKWKLTVDPLCFNCRSAPPGSKEVIAFWHESEGWLLILSVLIINAPHPHHPRINNIGDHLKQRWSPQHWLSIDRLYFRLSNL